MTDGIFEAIVLPASAQAGRGRIRIAAECARLESVYRETYRGFKSLILRKTYFLSGLL